MSKINLSAISQADIINTHINGLITPYITILFNAVTILAMILTICFTKIKELP